MVLSACDFSDFVHVFLNDFGNSFIVFVDCFTSLEVNVSVLCTYFADRSFRSHRSLSEFFDIFGFYEFCDIFVGNFFDFVYFVRSSESVKELEERNFSFVSG